MKVEHILRRRQVIIVIGTGGVGKTTISAALAYCAGYLGMKSLVLTVDPARRLASTLHLNIGDEEKKVEHNGVVFYASMLDLRRSMDRLIIKYAPNDEIKNAILNSRLYSVISDSIAGTQEYVAAERLYEILMEGNYDTIILDTPPAYEAVDFLKAPERVMEFFKDKFLRFFVGPVARASRMGFNIITQKMPRVFNPLLKIAGADFLKELLALIGTSSEMFDDMNLRSKRVIEMLRSPKTSFIYVTIPSGWSLRDFKNLKQTLREISLRLEAIILNRFQPDIISEEELRNLEEENVPEELRIIGKYYMRRRKIHEEIMGKILKKTSVNVIKVPEIPEGIEGLEGLKKLARSLL